MAVAPPECLESVPIHSVRVHNVTMAQTLDTLDRFVREGGPHHVVTLDASMCVMAREDADLRRIICAADLVTPDSTGILWACRHCGHPLRERVSGVEIAERLCERSAERGYRVFLFGSAPGVADEAARRFAERFPGCQIVGTRDGFFASEDEPDVVRQIAEAKPHVLLVALGIPKQEKWIDRHRRELGVPVMIGVGGSLDVHSGRVRRAPRLVQRLNLEWLYRLARNPRKVGKVLTLPRFLLNTLRAPRGR